ncbi:hypothetical protein [Microlunatus parietis]|uniref:Aminoglycoside phosphotransferase domain-containing protein n=1 Tax=Microlunatus parietis TaxID=682979 RepID=A0A7Y9LBI4_9ACTN|nr:hypothetical protein [Microlunatus parietis]NYE70680.1 hypothetical protein [Microlunatus parietis]
MNDPDGSVIIAALRDDPVIGCLVGELRAEPPGQGRIFRTRLRSSGTPCILKLADELEAAWMPAISARATDIVAEVLAHGVLSEPERPWLLLADLPHRARSDNDDIARDVMRAAARFQQEAIDVDLPTYPIDVDFMITYAQQAIDAGCPGPAADVLPRIGADDAWLRSLGGHLKGHGDVHFWNAVAAARDGPWRLIDPIPRTAHWAWDAAYAQLTSGVAETPDLIMLLAEERRRLGLPIPGAQQFDRLRTILLGWSSLLWWAILPARREEAWWRGEVERNVAAHEAL